ncbi:hypothetical protein ONE63_009958 [Megalurothrips usitatus]|uniref:Nuclear receptor subfamily 2 group E member 1 n=1 Tax=Megalurothrips usitatus TaxID=439358 RepID=A0AAV7XGB3_9NEOP|nr:hypothetical protein ONE63_009958 [Megalurothrips usitatus]
MHPRKEALCRVCGDKASGKHYGVPSCDGCRGFFKRSIRRNLAYVCKEGGTCTVDVSRRNQCQACRFRKCLEVNMKKDAVQHERAPRGLGAGLGGGLGAGPGSGGPGGDMHTTVILYPPPSPFAVKPGLFDGHTFGEGLYALRLSSGLPVAFQPLPNPPTSPRPPLARDKEDEVTSSEEARSQPSPGGGACFDNVYESAAKILFLAVKWARSIPAFLQLSGADQSVLLEEGWPDLFVLSAAQWQLPVHHETLVAGAVSPPSRRSALAEDARRLEEAVSRFLALRVDHTEYACLKALVLFKAEARGLADGLQVEALADQTHAMMSEYCAVRGRARLGRLLLLLPAVRALSSRSLQELFFRQTVGDVPIERLLGDMLNSP